MKRLFISVIAIAGILLFLWEPALPATSVLDQFDPVQIAQGRVLAGIGNCDTCHTLSTDGRFAGGRPMSTPFGTIFTSNITPDVEFGIGSWSLEAFTRAMAEGVSKDGSHLFPAFPYTHFALITDGGLVYR
ncbi:MAG: hypothetical protein ACI82A_002045 [Candidatus Azotimanducaceae bacterium]|jgi:hypothetical protein